MKNINQKVLAHMEGRNICSGNVWDKNAISPTITTCQGGNREPIVLDSFIVAMRGRNPEHPTDRTPGLPTEQRLEMAQEGMTNTLTTVQKDNLVLESCRMVRTEEGKHLRKAYENGEIKHGFNTMQGGGKQPMITEKEKTNEVGQISNEDYANAHVCKAYRIRKLTPKECWRLMGYTDEDFEKAAKVNSNTQLYKQAGNAIVKQVLMAIFLQMGIQGKKKWNEMSVEERQNLVNSSLDFLKDEN